MAIVAVVGALLCLLSASLYLFLKKRYAFWSEKNIPGPKPSLLSGNLSELAAESHLDVHRRWIQKYGKVVGVFDFIQPKLIIADADLAKQMLIRDFSKIADRRPDGFDHPFERKFSFIQKHDAWKKSRTVLSSAFSPSKLRMMFDQAMKCSSKLTDYVEHLATSSEGANIPAYEIFAKFVTDVISRSIFSFSSSDSYSEPEDKLVDSIKNWAVYDRTRRLISLILPGWFKYAISFSQFNMKSLDYASSLVKHILNERRSNDSPENDMVTSLLNSAEKIDWGFDHLVSNLVGLFIAGQTSTGSQLSFLVYALTKYPRIQEHLMKELDEFEKTGEPLTMDNLNQHFPYLDAVLTETQRLWPSSTYTERQVTADEYTFSYEGKEFTVPRGTVIYFPIFLIHRDADYYDRPDEFDETRFLSGKKEHLNAYAYLPFGLGPRNCVGARFAINNMKIAVLSFIKCYKFTLVDNDGDPMSDLSGTLDELLIPKPIRVNVLKTVH